MMAMKSANESYVRCTVLSELKKLLHKLMTEEILGGALNLSSLASKMSEPCSLYAWSATFREDQIKGNCKRCGTVPSDSSTMSIKGY